MSPSHRHSASLPSRPAPELYAPNNVAGGSIDFSLLNNPYPHPPLAQGVGRLRYYSPPMGALQLPNGDFVPYEVDNTVEFGSTSLMHPMPPHGQMLPQRNAFYGGGSSSAAPAGSSANPTHERRPSFESNGRLDTEGRGRNGNKSRSRYHAQGRGGSRHSRGVQKELKDNVRRTVYISDINQNVTEEELANMFSDSGSVVDCRVCGDPNSAKRFAFIEFSEDAGAVKALEKNGTVLGGSTIRVLPSKTAIVPVNKDFMPRNMEEMELCSRTVYIANIDKKVDKHDVRRFFEGLCGKVLVCAETMRLQGLRKITLQYAPLLPGSTSAAQFFRECTTKKALASNPTCAVELKLLERGEPSLEVEFENGGRLSMPTYHRTALQLEKVIERKQQDIKTLAMLREEGYQMDAMKREDAPDLEQAKIMARPFARKWYEGLKPV